MSGWRHEPFDSVIADESGGNLKTPQSEYLPSGRYAVVDQGKELIAGYTDDESRLCRAQLPVIVFGDHTRCFKYVDFPFCMGADGVKVLRPKGEIDVKYLYHYLRQLRLTEGGYDRHFKYLKRSSVVLPPLPEQRRIAEILDKADALRAKRRAALAQLDTLTQSIFLDMFGDPATNPKGWPLASLGEIGIFIRGITFKPDDVVGSDEPNVVACMRTKNVQTELDLSDTWWVSDRLVKRDDQFLKTGDILVSSANSWNLVGKCCWIPRLPMRTTFGGFVSVLRADHTKVQPEVLFTWFRSNRVQSLVRSFGQQTTNISNLNIQRTLALRLPLPPVKTQRAFCAAVEAERKLRATQLSSASTLDALFASLQHRAFRGEL